MSVSARWESLPGLGYRNGCHNPCPYLQAEEQWFLDGSVQRKPSLTPGGKGKTRLRTSPVGLWRKALTPQSCGGNVTWRRAFCWHHLGCRCQILLQQLLCCRRAAMLSRCGFQAEAGDWVFTAAEVAAAFCSVPSLQDAVAPPGTEFQSSALLPSSPSRSHYLPSCLSLGPSMMHRP